MNLLEFINAAVGVATLVSVSFAGYQLHLTKEQARTSFEDSLTQQYREIIRKIPVKALLKGDLSDEEHERVKDDFYRYFDLCNEQYFLYQTHRVSEKTWKLWRDGIKSHLSRRAFKTAWIAIKKEAGNDFSELKTLETEDFATDPSYSMEIPPTLPS